MEQILQENETDRNLKLLVFKSAGKVFSAGADVAEHHPDRVQEMMGHFDNLFHALNALQYPIIAEVRGAVVAALSAALGESS